jgi:hypothetical protein
MERIVCRAGASNGSSSESLAGEGWQDKCGLVDLLAVVPAQLLLLLDRPASQRLLKVQVGVLAADHEANLSGWVGGDRSVTVFDGGEDLLAGLLEVGDERHVQPLVLSYTQTSQLELHKTPKRRMDDCHKYSQY